MTLVLDVRGLAVSIAAQGELRPLLRDVTLRIGSGETHGLVGESGSGKSMTARALLRLLPKGATATGHVDCLGRRPLEMSRRELRGYRSVDVAMIFQDPQAHVNPVRTIGDFLTEALRTNRGMSASVARERVIGLLSDVWVDDASRRMRQYPHEVSGGMLQRVMIAAALAIEPRLLIADEPTTGLDVTTQAEVMAILDEQRQQRGLAMLFITHDLDLAASVCDRTTVMYAGSTVETNATAEVYEAPLHPYTAALLAARPDIGVKTRPVTIPGRPLSGPEAPSGCAFRDRCPYAQSLCSAEPLELVASDGGLVRCHRFRDLRFSLRELAHRHGGRA